MKPICRIVRQFPDGKTVEDSLWIDSRIANRICDVAARRRWIDPRIHAELNDHPWPPAWRHSGKPLGHSHQLRRRHMADVYDVVGSEPVNPSEILAGVIRRFDEGAEPTAHRIPIIPPICIVAKMREGAQLRLQCRLDAGTGKNLRLDPALP